MALERRLTPWIMARSIGFYVASILCALPYLLLLPGLVFPSKVTLVVTGTYLRIQLFLIRVICGVDYKVVDRKNLPDEACLIASQHASSWETLYFQVLLDEPVMFAKKEVFAYPLIGLLARKSGHIPVDRTGYPDAMRDAFKQGQAAARGGAQDSGVSNWHKTGQ